jgi:hypothetical protein
MLGNAPAVHSRQGRQQAQHKCPRPPPRGSTLRKRPRPGTSDHRRCPATGPGLRCGQRPPPDHHASSQTMIIKRWPSHVRPLRARDNDLLLEYQDGSASDRPAAWLLTCANSQDDRSAGKLTQGLTVKIGAARRPSPRPGPCRTPGTVPAGTRTGDRDRRPTSSWRPARPAASLDAVSPAPAATGPASSLESFPARRSKASTRAASRPLCAASSCIQAVISSACAVISLTCAVRHRRRRSPSWCGHGDSR